MKKPIFAALVFAVIAVMMAACSDNNSGSKPLEKEEYFIILSDSGSLIPTGVSQASSASSSEETSGYTLMMEDLSESVTWFANRPDRAAGQKTTSEFINSVWPGQFGAINPNALLDCRVSGQSLEDGMYLTLGNPVYDPENDRLTFASVTLHNWTMDEKPANPLSFDNVKLTLLPNCINPGATCWSWAQVSPSVSFVPSNQEGKYLLKMDHIYRELYHLQHAPGDGSEIMSTISMETYWDNIFQGIPPNASLSAYTDTGKLNLLLTIENPSYDSEDNTFTYEATVLSGDAESPEIMNTATLLIDSTGPVDYRKAAEREYEKLLDAWSYTGAEDKLMWYQGNALDTLIDYVSITQDAKKGRDLGEKIPTLWGMAKDKGVWWDDFGWWGIAFLNAARNFSILDQSDATEYNQYATYCLKTRMDQATQVWAMANEPPCIPCLTNPPANWYRFEPRFTGGVWNTAFAAQTPGKQDSCNPNKKGPPPYSNKIPVGTPEDDCSILTPLQNTVTNGLYLVLNTRYYQQTSEKQEMRKKLTLAIYGWFKNWMDVEDKEVFLCSENKVKQSLLNSETGLVRERVGTYAYTRETKQSPYCFTGVKWYEQDLSWAGDQGIVLGGLVDILNSKLTEDNQWLLEKAKGIIDGVKDHMARGMSGSAHDNLAPDVLRPWTLFDGWGPDDGEDPTFASPGGFGFGDPNYPQFGDLEYKKVCACENLKKEPPCPSEPPKVALDPTTNYIAGPGIFMRYLVYAYKNNKDLRDHIRGNEYLAFLKANADAVAYGTYSCSCNDIIASDSPDSKASKLACKLSCQITRLATLNAAMVVLSSQRNSDSD